MTGQAGLGPSKGPYRAMLCQPQLKAKAIASVRLMEKGHQHSPGKSPDHSHPLKLYSACMTATGPVHDL